MAIAPPHDHHGVGLLPGARSRHFRTLVLAGVLLIFVWTLREAPLFKAHYKSGFAIVDPSHPPPSATATATTAGLAPGQAPPKPQQPITLPGDNFYLTDALHAALHHADEDPAPPAPAEPEAPPPPPPPEREFPASVAVIMETDPAAVPNLVPIMLHFANVLGPAWPIVLVTLQENWVEPESPAFRRLMAERRIRITFLPPGTAFPDHDDVSRFMTRPWLWERFESADRVLLFQADSVLCSRSPRRVEDFAEWDLVGAPISSAYGVGFNGGLSLRNPRAMLAVVRDPALNRFEARKDEIQDELLRVNATEGPEGAERADRRIPAWEKFEDQWFFHMLRTRPAEAGIRLPDRDVASQFAVETVWAERPLGYHQPFRWMTPAQQEQMRAWCPEVTMLQDGSHFFARRDGQKEQQEEEESFAEYLENISGSSPAER